MTARFTDCSVWEAIDAVCRAFELHLDTSAEAVIIRPGAYRQRQRLGIYRVPPRLRERLRGDLEWPSAATARAYLQQRGIPFTAGAACWYVPEHDLLVLRHAPEQLRRAAGVLR